jgi:hypothetical protein
MDPSPELLPITRDLALAQGITPWQWRSLVETGELTRLRRGVYVRVVATEDRAIHAQRVAAELLPRTDHFAVSASAVALLELPNPYFRPWRRIPVRLAGPRSRPRRGIRHGTTAPITTPWGSCTDLIDTAVTVAAELPLPQALMVTDDVARRIADTKDRLVLASEECRNQVRRRLTLTADSSALLLANPAAESPAESFYRGHMILAGFPEPRCGVALRGASGRRYFADLVLDGLVIEVDGALKYRTVDDLREEKRREDDLRAMGHPFHRVPADDLFADPDTEMSRLRSARGRLALPA